MSAYEMMLSKARSACLHGAASRKGKEAEAIFSKWGSTSRSSATRPTICASRVVHKGDEAANLPIKDLGDKAPEYDRPWVEPKKREPLAANDIPQADVADAFSKMLGGPDLSSRRWVWSNTTR